MRPPGKLVPQMGGGVDSIAELLLLKKRGEEPPPAIVMADPGSEKRATMAYMHEWTNPMLRRWGWPEVTVISRKEEGRLRPEIPGRTRRYETLYEQSIRQRELPSIAYNENKTCSLKFKKEPQYWWAARQPWAQAEWAAGRKLVAVIGYDFDPKEQLRVQRAVTAWVPPPPRPTEHRSKNCPECRTESCAWPRDRNKWGRERFVQWFPLFEARLTRADCEQMIRDAKMPLPPKSSCTFCPNNTMKEWEELRRNEPEAFEAALVMSRNADLDNPHDIGLLRRNPSGRKQLHQWAAGCYDGLGPLFEQDIKQACECST